MIKTINYLLQSILIYSFFLVGILLRLNMSRKLFSFLFVYIGPIFKSKKIINRNLDIFSKKISSQNRKKIINNMWKNYGKTFIEYIFLDYFRKNNSHTVIIGEENLSQIIKKNKQVIFISGHFANFELMSMEITKKNINLATIYRPLNNFFLNPFMEYLRAKFVCSNQIKKGRSGVKDSINYIKKGYSIALMIDQRVSEGIKVNFFNNSALTTTIPAQFVKKFQAQIVPVYIERLKNDNFKIKINDPMHFSKNETLESITLKLNLVLEDMIKVNPEQWIWTHNRWK